MCYLRQRRHGREYRVKGKCFTVRHLPLRGVSFFSEREKTNRRAAHQITCLAAAQMAIATDAKRFVPEVL
jgi:hypothetical protein